ncbi:MAG: ankyrin repeat domain-containing protein [Candidatus Berkiella sp.]
MPNSSPLNAGLLLYQAIASGNEEKVNQLLSLPSIPEFDSIKNTVNEQSEPLLLLAIRHPDIFKKLLEAYDKQISALVKGEVLGYAAGNGHIAIVKHLLEQCGASIDNEDKGDALLCAAGNGHIAIVKYLLEQCGARIDKEDKGDALLRTAGNGHIAIVKYLLEQCGASIDNLDKGDALVHAARNGHMAIVKYLLEQYSSDISNVYKGIVLANVAHRGYTEIVKYLLEQCGASIDNQFKEMALVHATQNGHTEIVKYLFEQHSSDISNGCKGIVLCYAASNGQTEIVTYVLQHHSADISNNEKIRALIFAVQNTHVEVLNVLLEDESVVAVAHGGNNRVLREAVIRINGAENEDERARYQAIIERLIQIPAVAEWVRQHANRETGLADITRFAENSMQKLTQKESALINHLKSHYSAVLEDKTWIGIRAEILSYLEHQYHQSPAIDGYHYVWMLENNSEIPTDFIPADTIGIHPRDEKATLYWRDIDNVSQQKVVSMSDVVECYQQINKNNWLHQNAQDANLVERIVDKFGITPHPRQGEKCPLNYEDNQNQSRLVAYYRHAVHNAWRYLSSENPWMSPQAQFIETLEDGGRRAIIDDLNKELISYFWIALNDETIQLEPGFSAEGNKNILAGIIALLNRGHNTDERALFLKDLRAFRNEEHGIKTTTADDLKADAPTCVYGLMKRLLQSQYGHPYINAPEAQPLSLEILQDRMIDQLIRTKEQDAEFDNLIDKLNGLVNKKVLEYIQEKIGEICDLLDDDNEKIMLNEDEKKQYESIFSFPERQLQAFMERTMLWFGKERIEQQHNEKLKMVGSSSVFLSKEHDSYKDFIEYCAENPLHAFAGIIYGHVNELLEKIKEKVKAADKLVSDIDLLEIQEKQPDPILNAYEDSRKNEGRSRLTGEKRKCGDDNGSDNNPCKRQRPS